MYFSALLCVFCASGLRLCWRCLIEAAEKSRRVIGALGARSGLLLMLLAVLPANLFGNCVPSTGVLATLPPVDIGSLILAAIVLPVWVIGRLQRWSNQRQARLRRRGLDCELAQLARDPELSHGLPLASHQMTANPATLAGWDFLPRWVWAMPSGSQFGSAQ